MSQEQAVLESVERHLEEADCLIGEGHPEMALVRAVSAFEVFMKEAFIAPYLRNGILSSHPDLGQAVVDALLSSNAWRGRLPAILKSCWGIDVKLIPTWQQMGAAWSVRNQIVHAGASCDLEECERYVSAAQTLMKALLIARLDGNAAAVENL